MNLVSEMKSLVWNHDVTSAAASDLERYLPPEPPMSMDPRIAEMMRIDRSPPLSIRKAIEVIKHLLGEEVNLTKAEIEWIERMRQHEKQKMQETDG